MHCSFWIKQNITLATARHLARTSPLSQTNHVYLAFPAAVAGVFQ